MLNRIQKSIIDFENENECYPITLYLGKKEFSLLQTDVEKIGGFDWHTEKLFGLRIVPVRAISYFEVT